MATFDVLVQPRKKEVYAPAVHEALASGVPVVAFDGGTASDVVRPRAQRAPGRHRPRRQGLLPGRRPAGRQPRPAVRAGGERTRLRLRPHLGRRRGRAARRALPRRRTPPHGRDPLTDPTLVRRHLDQYLDSRPATPLHGYRDLGSRDGRLRMKHTLAPRATAGLHSRGLWARPARVPRLRRVATRLARSAVPASAATATVQRRLNALHCNAGPADGVNGGWTRSAVIRFQSRHGLAQTGSVNPATRSRLFASTAPPVRPPRGPAAVRARDAAS